MPLTTEAAHVRWQTPLLSEIRKRLSSLLEPCAEPGCRHRGQSLTGLRRRHSRVKLASRWYCTGDCLESAAAEYVSALKASYVNAVRAANRMPLGLLLVSRGEVSLEQVRQALRAQSQAPAKHLGEWLQELGYATEEQITGALSLQWSCPVLRISSNAQSTCAQLLPRTLQEAYSMFPVHFVPQTRSLYVGFADRIVHRLLYAVEQTLGCRTVPCLVTLTAFKDAAKRIAPASCWPEVVFEPGATPQEVARVIVSYAQRCSSQEIRITSCGEYIWARLLSRHSYCDLLFHT